MAERIIKSKERIQQHGEVFTPRWVVEEMLHIPEIKVACEKITATFLEPAAGEGAFLVAILEKKLTIVEKSYHKDLYQYENFALLALTTLYGIELLVDNVEACRKNLFECFKQVYQQQAAHHQETMKEQVLESAKQIITTNIVQGDFLTRRNNKDQPITFYEWKPVQADSEMQEVIVERTIYTFDEIFSKEARKEPTKQSSDQLDLFEMDQVDDLSTKKDFAYAQRLSIRKLASLE